MPKCKINFNSNVNLNLRSCRRHDLSLTGQTKEIRVKLIIGAIGKDKKIFVMAKQKLCEKFGPSDYESDFFHFKFTDYYYKEMGDPLLRKFYTFKKPISPDKLIDIKLFTNGLEDIYRNKNNSRKINLDPGYIEEGKLILSTHKNHQHRVYLGKGVFAEVTLRYSGGTFKPWEWTYPDYKSQEYIQFFNKIRKALSSEAGRLN